MILLLWATQWNRVTYYDPELMLQELVWVQLFSQNILTTTTGHALSLCPVVSSEFWFRLRCLIIFDCWTAWAFHNPSNPPKKRSLSLQSFLLESMVFENTFKSNIFIKKHSSKWFENFSMLDAVKVFSIKNELLVIKKLIHKKILQLWLEYFLIWLCLPLKMSRAKLLVWNVAAPNRDVKQVLNCC